MWIEPTIDEVAESIRLCLAAGDDFSAVRLALRVVERFDLSTSDVRRSMVSNDPRLTGSARFDALLAAVVEYCCAVHMMAAPRWVDNPERFLDEFWFLAESSRLEADAVANSPISFVRRGVFVNSGALEYA
jgi:hypothetical protein